jgi:3',5'-cyclic AMP phosphodiesterase CpdA
MKMKGNPALFGTEDRPAKGMLDRRRFLRQTGKGLLCIGLSPLLSRCGGDITAPRGDDRNPDENFAFAVISDTHLLGDSDPLQHEVFGLTVEWLNGFSPALDLVVITGDVVDFLPSDDPAYYDENHSALHRLQELTSGLRMPLHLVLGNHDYYTGGEILHGPTQDKPARERLFMDRMGMPGPYYAFEHQGVKFYCLNSMQQDPSFDWSPNAVGIFGPEQVSWLADGLADGKPAFLFHHHPLATELTTGAGFSALIPFEVPRADGNFRKYQGTPLADYTDPIYQLLQSHRGQVKATFFGHAHLFLRDDYESASLFMTDSMQFPSHTEYDGKPMRFHIVECRANTGAFTIHNAFMIHYWQEDGVALDRAPVRELDPALFL